MHSAAHQLNVCAFFFLPTLAGSFIIVSKRREKKNHKEILRYIRIYVEFMYNTHIYYIYTCLYDVLASMKDQKHCTKHAHIHIFWRAMGYKLITYVERTAAPFNVIGNEPRLTSLMSSNDVFRYVVFFLFFFLSFLAFCLFFQLYVHYFFLFIYIPACSLIIIMYFCCWWCFIRWLDDGSTCGRMCSTPLREKKKGENAVVWSSNRTYKHTYVFAYMFNTHCFLRIDFLDHTVHLQFLFHNLYWTERLRGAN